jgi:hypothetical protein
LPTVCCRPVKLITSPNPRWDGIMDSSIHFLI